MHFKHENMSLWYGISDTPAPGEAVKAGNEVRLTIGVQPADASNQVEVRYRVNGGEAKTAAAKWTRNNPARKAQYFKAVLPAFRAGDRVEYGVVCRCAGRMAPAPDEAQRFASSFHVTETGAKPTPDLASQETSAPASHFATGARAGTASSAGAIVQPVIARSSPSGVSIAEVPGSGGQESAIPADVPNVIVHEVVGQLLNQETDAPLAGFTVRAHDRNADADVGYDITDKRGLFVLAFAIPDDAKRTEKGTTLRLRIMNPSGNEIHRAEIHVSAEQEQLEVIRVPVAAEPTRSAIRRPAESADLATLSLDAAADAALIDKGFTSVSAIANTPRSDFVVATHGEMGDFNAAQTHVGSQAQMHLLNNIIAGVRADLANGFPASLADPAPNSALDISELFPTKCGCRDCQAAVSPLAYLADLLDYAITHLKNDDASINLTLLAETFHQPFGDLPASCDELQNQVRQVRICTEVLRSYLETLLPLGATEADALRAAEKRYKVEAYTTFLTKIGTSYKEIRLARTLGDDDRKGLANRLGFDLTTLPPAEADELSQLFLDPDAAPGTLRALTEGTLESLFGLVDTARDPLADGPVPKLRSWRLEYLRTIWRKQDWPDTEPEDARPLIDPDLIGPGDLKDPIPGDTAFEILEDRQQFVADTLAALKTERETNGVRAVIEFALEIQLQAGEAIKGQIVDHDPQIPTLQRLLEITDLYERSQPLLESEWDEFDAILTQVQKVKQFEAWRAGERADGIILSPDHFRIAEEEPEGLPRWPATLEARRDWQDTLQTRIDQELATIEALRKAIDETEEETLTMLRDALIVATGQSAKELTDHLLIDCETDACQETTRIAEAIETLQGLLFSVRTGQLKDTYPNLTLNADNFDEEWEWIGSYATWRAAMFVFLYPENVLLPHFRRWQTPAFRELVRELRNNRRLTPEQACESAARYAKYFKDVCKLRLEASVQALTKAQTEECRTTTSKGDRYLVYLFARGGATNTVYVSPYDPEDDTSYTQSFWEPVPGLENALDVVGAAAYEISEEERSIYLFIRVREKSEQKLVYTTYDLEQGKWSGETNELELPEEATAFTAVVKQRNREKEPPHLAIRVPGGAIYARLMNRDGSDWADEYWHPIIGRAEDWHPLIGRAKGRKFGKLCAMIELAPNEFYLFVSAPDGRLRYRLFGHWDDGRWRQLDFGFGSWLGGFPWPSTEKVYAFWKFASGSQTLYQSIHRSTGALSKDTREDFNDFNHWLEKVAGVSLAGLVINESTSYSGMTLLEFFNIDSENPKDDEHFDPHIIHPYFENLEKALRKQFYKSRALSYIKSVAGQLEKSDDPGWKEWKLADEMVQRFSFQQRRTLEAVLTQLLEQKMVENAPGVDFKERAVEGERSGYSTGLSGLDSLVYGSGEAPADLTGRVAYQRTFKPPSFVMFAPAPGWTIPLPQIRVDRYRSVFIRESDNSLRESAPIQIAPTVTGPFDITEGLSESELQARRWQIKGVFGKNTEAPSSVKIYLEEAWYFVPIHVALQLQRRRQFIAALDWFRTVYDYSVAGAKRNIYYGLVLEKDLSTALERSEGWLLDPLDPHAIAATRAGTYTRFTILSLIRCFLEFADAEFTRDTAESLPRARTLYKTALELLDLPGLKQNLGTCDDLIGEIDITLGDPQWALPISTLRGELGQIHDFDTVRELTTEVKTLLQSYGPMGENFAEARARIREALAEQSMPPTFQTVLAEKAKTQERAHAAMLSHDEVLKAVRRVGEVARDDFATGVTIVTDERRDDTGLSQTENSLEFLRLPMELAANSALTSTDSFSLGGTLAGNAETGKRKLSVDETASTNVGVLGDDRRAEPMELIKTVTTLKLTFTPGISYQFCVPPNPILRVLRLHAELNLYKLRNCRNIAGLEREIPLYAAPTDVMRGLRMIGEAGLLFVPGTIAPPPTSFRYEVLIERAKQLADRAAQIESAFLAALEKRDAEYYNRMKARQEVQLARTGVRLQDLRVREAQDGVKLAELQRERAHIQANHYEDLLTEGKSAAEIASLALLGAAAATYTLAAVASWAGFWSSLTNQKQALGFTGQALATTSSVLGQWASYERRAKEWALQRDVAQQDILIGSHQVKLAKDRVHVVGQERIISQMQADFAETTADFLANKFTNAELYDWMSNILEGVYSFFLQQATAMAKLAEMQLAFERQQTPPALIQADYWEAPSDDAIAVSANDNAPDRRGLTGSARLLADVYKLDQYRFETEKRKLQLTKTISLARLAPVEFQQFRETGVMPFNTTMELFDHDFPGHYLRLIKRVRTSVIALIPPTEGIHATLSTTGISRVVVGNNGIFKEIGASRPPESVALSSPRDATGLFELTPQPQEMLLPFEGMGVDTAWELQMPKASNLFDYNTITDVLFTIEYTALASPDYRQQVIQKPDRGISADRPFSFRHQFADQWYDLHNPEQTENLMVVHFDTKQEDFPPNIEDLRIQQVVLYFAKATGQPFEVPAKLRFKKEGSDEFEDVGGEITSIDGVISTRQNAIHWLIKLHNQIPFGEWEFVLPNTDEIKNRFKNEKIEDILFVITYSGRTPEWPA